MKRTSIYAIGALVRHKGRPAYVCGRSFTAPLEYQVRYTDAEGGVSSTREPIKYHELEVIEGEPLPFKPDPLNIVAPPRVVEIVAIREEEIDTSDIPEPALWRRVWWRIVR